MGRVMIPERSSRNYYEDTYTEKTKMIDDFYCLDEKMYNFKKRFKKWRLLQNIPQNRVHLGSKVSKRVLLFFKNSRMGR